MKSLKNRLWFLVVGFILISALNPVLFSCYASGNSEPKVILEGSLWTESKLKIVLPDTTAVLTGEEIAAALNLTEGILILKEKTLSPSGFPTLVYSEFELESRSIDITVEAKDTRAYIFLEDKSSGKKLTRIVKSSFKAPIPPRTNFSVFTVRDGILSVEGSGTLDLSRILIGGTWSKIVTSTYESYEQVLRWKCTPDIPKHIFCYCDSTLPVEDSRDNPTCWSYDRTADVAVKRVNNGKALKLVIFEENFMFPKSFNKEITLQLEPF
ncbi:MAG: hypothetical protein ACLFQB_11170 [Chitinispirillaceae bacterium]